MKQLMVVLCFLSASSAIADFNGTWVGPVGVSKPGTGCICPSVTFTIEQTTTQIVVKTEEATCDNGTTLPALIHSLEIQGQNLLLQNQVVGTISDSSLSAHFRDPDKGDLVQLSFSRVEDMLTISDVVTEPQGLASLIARLKKQ